MKVNKYDSFFKTFIAFLLEYDLLKSKQFSGLSLTEIAAFEKKYVIKFDDSIRAYLNIFGNSFRQELKFKAFSCYSLNGIRDAISHGIKKDIYQQIVNNEKNEIDTWGAIKIESSLAGKILPIAYVENGGYFSFVEQGIENPIILGIFNSSLDNDDNYLLSDNCNITQRLRHGLFLSLFYHFRLGGASDLSFSQLIEQPWVKALAFLIETYDKQLLQWRGDFYSKKESRNHLGGIPLFEHDFLKFVYQEKGVLELKRFLNEA